jgi:hypothetical protein
MFVTAAPMKTNTYMTKMRTTLGILTKLQIFLDAATIPHANNGNTAGQVRNEYRCVMTGQIHAFIESIAKQSTTHILSLDLTLRKPNNARIG